MWMTRRVRNRRTLEEAVSLPQMISFFSYLESLPAIAAITPATLGNFYLDSRSAEKYVSHYIDRRLRLDPDYNIIIKTIDESDVLALSNRARGLFGDKWQREWDAITAEYGILDNTDAHVTHTTTTQRDGTEDELKVYGKTQNHVKSENTDMTDKTEYGKSTHIDGVDERKIGETTTYGKKTETTNDNTTTNSTNAFNSASMTPQTDSIVDGDTTETLSGQDKLDTTNTITENSTTTDSGNDTKTTTGTISGTDDITDGGQDTGKVTKNETEKITYEETRKGNIGVTTSQQMLTSEMEFRAKFKMFDIISNDIDTLFTIPKFKTR